MALSIRVIQYNLLSSHLADPEFHTKCVPEDLVSETRLKRHQERFKDELKQKSIFCLQEVSQDWTSKFLSFFEKHDYVLVSRNYGNKFNGYMGVAVAYPRKLFELVETSLLQVGDHLPTSKVVSQAPFQFFGLERVLQLVDWNKWFGSTIKAATELICGPTPEDHWERASWKKNTLILLRLKVRESGHNFTVGCYHMPCDFRRPTVMMLHASVAVKLAQDFSAHDPLVLAGDWNFQPDSPFYQFVRTGLTPTKFSLQKSPTAVDDWKPDSLGIKPMDSAMVQAFGKEPAFTNYAFTEMNGGKAFIGTLDYIFLSQTGWGSVTALALPENSKAEEVFDTPLPTEQEPSDHLMLAVNLSVKN